MKITGIFTLATAGVTLMASSANASGIMLRGQDSQNASMIEVSDIPDRSLSSSMGRWVRCANDYQDCNLNIRQQERVHESLWVRYGTAAGRKLFRQAQGKAICSPHFFQGDPARGKEKFCEYYVPGDSETEESESKYELKYRVMASDFQDVNVPSGVYMLKYGPLSGPFLYTQVGVNGRLSKYACGAGKGKFPDIAKGTKKYCQLSTTPIRGPNGKDFVNQNDWTLCAHEGQPCVFNGFNNGGYLVRYGHGSSEAPKFTYMQVDDPDRQFLCAKSTFDDIDPVRGTLKYCEYLPLKEAFSSHTGYWRLAGHVKPTASGGSFSETITEGVSKTEGLTITNSFSQTLTSSIAQKSTYLGGETAVTLTSSVTNSIARAVSKSTTFTSQKSCTISCNAGPNEEVYAYQWVMDSQMETSPATRASFDTATCLFQCTNDKNGPRCSLGMTFDQNKQECVEGDDDAVHEGQSSAN